MAAVDEEKRKRTAFPTDIPAQSIYGRGAVRQPAAPAQSAIPGAAPLADVPAMAKRQPVNATSAGPIVGRASKPPEAASGFGAFPGVQSVMRGSGENMSNLVDRGQYGAAAGELARATTALVPAVVSDVASPLAPVVRGVGAGVRQFFTGSAQDQAQTDAKAAPSAAQPPLAQKAAAIVAAAPEGVNASQTSPQAAPVTASLAAAPATQKQEGVDVGFGIRRMEGPGGTPLYTNIQPGAPMPAQPPQPMYRQPQDQPVQRIQPERQRQDVVMPRLNTGGGVFSAMADFTNQAGNALGAVAQNRANNQQDRAGREDAKMGLDANRYALDAAITQNRFGMDRQRAGLDAAKAQDDMATNQVRRDAAQVEVGAARQAADLQRQYLEAPTEEARAEVAKKISALSGKSAGAAKDNFIVVGGGQEWDQASGLMRNVPQRLIDVRTGQEVGAPAGQKPSAPAQQSFVIGQTYTDAQGSKARWDGEKFVPVK